MYTNQLRNQVLFFVLASSMLFFSCAKQRDFVYFQRTVADSLPATVIAPNIPVLKTEDKISIVVSAVDPDVVKPFNLSAGASSSNQTDSKSSSGMTGFLIDEQGEIDFPVLGKLKLAGLTRSQATQLLKDRLKTYVNNPIIQVQILNHKVTILGEVGMPGIYPIANERLTVLDALATAGDLKITGVRKNVLVVREVDGVKTETRIDLTNQNLFSSPVYYLQNNDLVYVEPNKGRINSSTPVVQFASVGIGLLSLIFNAITLLTR